MSPDPFAPSVPSVSWKNAQPGTMITMTVLEAPELVQSRDFETGQPALWPDGNPKMSAVMRVKLSDGEERSLWAAKPSSMFAAISAAQVAAGAQITRGGTLTITYTGDKANENPRLNPAKQYAATYTPPSGAFTTPGPVTGEATAPSSPSQWTPGAPSTPTGPTPEQLAAVKAAGLDPAVVFAGQAAS